MKRVLFLLITVLAIAIAFTSCKKEKEKTYTVTFNSNGGSEVEAQTIAEGANAVEPQPEPTQEGYYFGGWYTNYPALTNKWNFAADMVTANITLYAKWGTVKLLETITECCRIRDGYVEPDFEKYDKYKFEYDERNRITKMFYYYLDYTYTFTYAGDDLVQVLFSDNSGGVETYEYTKSENIITQKYAYSGSIYIPGFTTTSTIELDSDGLPITREEERNGNTYVETYYYQNGNLTKKAITVTSPVYGLMDSDSYYYWYDNEKGALYHCKTPKWGLILHLNDFGVKNNITAESWIRHSGEYIYEFDHAGFPAKHTYKGISGMASHTSEWVEEYTYITK